MNAQNNNPASLFNDSTFKTLYGGALVTWVSTGVAVRFIEIENPEIITLISALIVAFVAFFLKEQRDYKKLLIVPFNGFLIFFTVIGGNSQLPNPPVEHKTVAETPTPSGNNSKPVVGELKFNYGFFTKWNVDKETEKKKIQLNLQKQQLQAANEQLQKDNTEYKVKLNNTRKLIQQNNITPEVKDELLKHIQANGQLMLNNVNH